MTKTTSQELVLEAVTAVAAQCDGAQKKDGQGFNGQDTAFGKRLASLYALAPKAVTEEMVAEAAVMLLKYRRQITEALGWETCDAVVTFALDQERQPGARQDARRALQAKTSRKVTLNKGLLVFHSKYDAALVAAFRDLPGRSWNASNKTNDVPLVGLDVAATQAFIETWGFVTDDEVEQAIEDAATAKTPKTAVVNPRTIEIAGDRVLLHSPAPWEKGGVPIEAFRALSGRVFDGRNKVNHAPINKTTRDFAVEHDFEGIEKIDAALEARSAEEKAAEAQADANRAASAAADAEPIEGVEVGMEPYGYQWAGIRHVLENRRVLIGDEMGVGKTITALVSLEAAGGYPAVIVVPEVVRGNWGREIERFLPHRSYEILTGTTPWETTADIVIIGYTALRSKNAAWAKSLARRGFKALVCDESHALKNQRTAQTKAVKILAEAVK